MIPRTAGLLAATMLLVASCSGGPVRPIEPRAGGPTTTPFDLPPTSEVSSTAAATSGEETTTSRTTSTTTQPLRETVFLEIESRTVWGAEPPDRPLTEHRIDTITIHHTARPHDETPMSSRLQGWQRYHQSLGFGDVAYHMIISRDGTIYQARDYRFAGSTRTSYDPTGHFLPSLDGMFDEFWDSPGDGDDEPDGADNLSDEQLAALIDLLAWAVTEFDIDPAEIGGHRDHAATVCPGSVVYDIIESGRLGRLVEARAATVDIELVYAG